MVGDLRLFRKLVVADNFATSHRAGNHDLDKDALPVSLTAGP